MYSVNRLQNSQRIAHFCQPVQQRGVCVVFAADASSKTDGGHLIIIVFARRVIHSAPRLRLLPKKFLAILFLRFNVVIKFVKQQ